MLSNIIKELNKKKEIYINIKAVPGSSHNLVKEIMSNGTVKVYVAAAPEKNKANQELIKFMASELGVKKVNVKVISGATSREKLLKISI